MRRWLTLALALAGCFNGRADDVRFVPDTSEEPTFQGIVSVSPEMLELSAEPGGPFVVGTVVVSNIGEYPLELRSAALIDDGDEALATDEDTNSGRSIGPDRSFEVLVRCELPAGDTDLPDTDLPDTDPPDDGVQGVLRVRTNDPATPSVDVTIRCTRA